MFFRTMFEFEAIDFKKNLIFNNIGNISILNLSYHWTINILNT